MSVCLRSASELGSIRSFTGLTEAEAAARLKTDGFNELPTAKPRSFFATAWEILHEPMVLLLVGAGFIYLFIGELKDALVLFVSIFAVLGINLYQQRKTEHALEALRDLSSPRALVIRNGRERRIAGREVVRGDVVLLSEGDRVPADGIVFSAVNLSVNESLLTGESVPVRKIAADDLSGEIGKPGGDDLPFVFSGTMVIQGQGYAEIRATGQNAALGKIGKTLEKIGLEATKLQAEVNRLTMAMAAIGLSLCVVIAVSYSLIRGGWLNGFLAGITAAMSLLPEEFPVVLTIFLALGAWRMSQRRVLTRHGRAIEALGSATVLCVDKTGTLTQNRMSVQKLFAGGNVWDVRQGGSLSEDFHELAEYSILASKRNPLDPMEIAFQEFGSRSLGNTEHLHQGWELAREYPLSGTLLAMSRVWKPGNGDNHVIAAKGAPEAILRLCRATAAQESAIKLRASEMAAEGLRILAVAKCESAETGLPDDQLDMNYDFVGLVGLADPLRPEVPSAVAECYDAGVRVVMITGDYPQTAQSIAMQAGIRQSEPVLTGTDLDRLTDEQLQQQTQLTNLFARVVPEQKLRLVNALKANGEIVAMTGDGVNDAPALKAAQIGIAMGKRGTDVAREAADLVLLDDSFSSIVEAIRLGRRIFDNLRKAMSFVFAVHVPIAGVALLPIVAGWPLVLMPVHIVFLELIVDPACSIAFEAEPEEPGIMQRPPRNPGKRLLPKARLLLSGLQGASVLVAVVLVLAGAVYLGETESNVRTVAFTTLVIGNIMLILANRSWTRMISATLAVSNPALWWVIGAASGLLPVIIYVPFLRSLFRFSALHPLDIVICLSAGIASLLWFEAWKLIHTSRLFGQGAKTTRQS